MNNNTTKWLENSGLGDYAINALKASVDKVVSIVFILVDR